ncbi:MAG: trypsin-like peptidase domain-containing protein [Verrucomicrobia bacterium]|jgi:S1-C subfamily serine protease|nr:trypsin-like peptidase domain-containing protein [Verrucomicrobiota bacterium]
MSKQAILRAPVLAALVMVAGPAGPAAVLDRDASDLRRDATVAAVEAVMPCVVNVATASVVQYSDFYDRLLRDYYGWGNSLPREKLNSIGSGVIIDEDGWVLTNLHVVRRASRVEVKLWNGEVYEADPMVATELSDVALLKLRLPPGKKLQAVRFARDEDLWLGETVLALGNPFGLGGSVTRGILSSKNRRPTVDDVPLDYQDWLQTDAAINPGNSGGPLINLEGELIGLNVAVYREGQGIGFAIPVRKVAEALSQFFTPEVSNGLWFGARARQDESGLTISYVQARSPAAEAGLREGQRIIEVNGATPRTLIEFNEHLCAEAEHRPRLTVRSAEGVQGLKVTLVPFDELISKKLGLSIMFLVGGNAAQPQIPGRAGLYVTAVERGGPADQAGLRPGALVAALGDREARDLLTVANVVSSTRPGDLLSLTVVESQRFGSGLVQYRQRGVPLKVR